MEWDWLLLNLHALLLVQLLEPDAVYTAIQASCYRLQTGRMNDSLEVNIDSDCSEAEGKSIFFFFFTWVDNDRIRENIFKLKEGSFRLDIWEFFH